MQEKDGIQRIDQTQKKEMVSLRFRTFEGDLLDIEAQIGQTLLEVARANDLPSLEGVCGGNLGKCFSLYLMIEDHDTEDRERMRYMSFIPTNESYPTCSGTWKCGIGYAGVCDRVQGRAEQTWLSDQGDSGIGRLGYEGRGDRST